MGWQAKNDKTRNSRFSDLSIVGYKNLPSKIFEVLKIYLTYEIFAKLLF